MEQFDVLVLGTGSAGLTAAITAHGRVTHTEGTQGRHARPRHGLRLPRRPTRRRPLTFAPIPLIRNPLDFTE